MTDQVLCKSDKDPIEKISEMHHGNVQTRQRGEPQLKKLSMLGNAVSSNLDALSIYS